MYVSSARIVRSAEATTDEIVGDRRRTGFLSGRSTLDLDCRGDGWKVSASVANCIGEDAASALKMIEALKTAIALLEERTAQEKQP